MNTLIPVGYNLIKIEALRHIAREKYQAVLQSEWKHVRAKGSKAKSWWGYRNRKQKVSFLYKTGSFGENLHWDHVYPLKLLDILTTPFDDLPTRINDPLDEEALQALKDMLSGTKQPIPHNQALTNEYFRADRHLNHYSGIVYRCTKKIEEYIIHKAYELYPKRMQYSDGLSLALTINNRTYTVILNHGSKHITLCPENTTEILTESDVINDELKRPLIHGTKTWMVEVRSRRHPKKGKARRARVSRARL